MNNHLFQHDGVILDVPNISKHAATFRGRSLHEPKFRKLNKILIDYKIITNNIIDSGAWIGDNSLPWAKMINGIVYAIDPSFDNCSFIKQLAEHNNISNISIITTALTDSPKTISTNWDLYHCSFVNGLGGKNTIEATTIDTLYKNNIIKDIGYIHLDVEGMEFLVLKGAEECMFTYRPVITFEQHINTDPYIDICHYLKDLLSYKTFLLNEVLPGCLPDCRNFLAFPDRSEINIDNTIQLINNSMGSDFLSYIE